MCISVQLCAPVITGILEVMKKLPGSLELELQAVVQPNPVLCKSSAGT